MKALVYSLTPFRWVICKAAGFFSKQAFYGAISPLRLEERPLPELPGPEWVRLRTILGGVCGTDLALIAQRNHPATILQNFASFPAVLGHENVAVVDELGAAVPEGWRGRRVCVEPAGGCIARGAAQLCPQCSAGRTSLCEYIPDDGLPRHDRRLEEPYFHDSVVGPTLPPRAILGLSARISGSWAEYFVAHRTQLHAVPDEVSDDEAVMADALASAAHAILRRRPQPNETVLVNGGGMISLGLIAAIRALGHDNAVTAIVRHPFQAELARRLGATTALVVPRRLSSHERYAMVAGCCGGKAVPCRFSSADLLGGFDLTFDCTGAGAGLSDAIKWTRSRGAVVAVGTSGIAVVDTTSIWFNELQVVGAYGRQIEAIDGRETHTYDLVLDWLHAGKVQASCLPVKRYRLVDYRPAFAELLSGRSRRFVKAAFQP